MALDPKGGFDQIMSMARGFQASKMLMVAVDLGLFDFLVEPQERGGDRGLAQGGCPGYRHLFKRPGGAGTPGKAGWIILRTASWHPAIWCGARKTTGGPSSST